MAVRGLAGAAHMVRMTTTTDPRIAAILEHNPTLKFVGAGTITDVLAAADATARRNPFSRKTDRTARMPDRRTVQTPPTGKAA